jgi:hypothetical protein
LVVLNQFFYELFSCKHVVSLDIYLTKNKEVCKFLPSLYNYLSKMEIF